MRSLEDSANLPDLGLSQSARHCAGQHNDRPEGGATGETLNRYIDGGTKRDQTTDLRGIENSHAEFGLVAQKSQTTRPPLPAFASPTSWQAATSHAS